MDFQRFFPVFLVHHLGKAVLKFLAKFFIAIAKKESMLPLMIKEK